MAAMPEDLVAYVEVDVATKALIDILEICRDPKCAGILERCNRVERIARVAARALRQLKVTTNESAERGPAALAGATASPAQPDRVVEPAQ